MKPSPSPRAAGWGCIWQIVIWSMRGCHWRVARVNGRGDALGRPYDDDAREHLINRKGNDREDGLSQAG